MSYNKFKIKDLETKLGLKVVQKAWLPDTFPIFAEDHLLAQTLVYTETEALFSEKARSEFIIAPVLQAFRRSNMERFSIFSGYEFNIDKSIELNGFCDFILTRSPLQSVLTAPLVAIVEAKNDNLRSGLGQCVAAMVAAREFNSQAAAGLVDSLAKRL